MMTWKVPIYNTDIPKPKRIFDVDVDEDGNICRYCTQNIKGRVCVETVDVERQIKEFFNKSKL